MAILITGGAGYIGSHTLQYLIGKNETVIVLDNFSTGHKEALLGAKYYKGSIGDPIVLEKIFIEHKIETVIHFAANSLVGESVNSPLSYYENNLVGTYNLVKKMVEYNVKNIVFSSTAAIYGDPVSIPIEENNPTIPTNPYGETKLAIEKMLKWCDQAYGIKSICLRYFNAAGADPAGKIGESHDPESHLIPIALKVALTQIDKLMIFGDDYQTKDGTCIRDYIHVIDLAQAHYLAVKKLNETNESSNYNLGNGQGFSVKEVIETCRKVTGKSINAEVAPRRPGDPAVLIASSNKAKKELGWSPQYPDLESIVLHAWKWHLQNPTGFSK